MLPVEVGGGEVAADGRTDVGGSEPGLLMA
jgi:hypothetical protein